MISVYLRKGLRTGISEPPKYFFMFLIYGLKCYKTPESLFKELFSFGHFLQK